MDPDARYRSAARQMVVWRGVSTFAIYAMIGSLVALVLPSISIAKALACCALAGLAYLLGYFMRLYWREECQRIDHEDSQIHE